MSNLQIDCPSDTKDSGVYISNWRDKKKPDNIKDLWNILINNPEIFSFYLFKSLKITLKHKRKIKIMIFDVISKSFNAHNTWMLRTTAASPSCAPVAGLSQAGHGLNQPCAGYYFILSRENVGLIL